MSFGVQSTQPAVLADLGRRHGTMAHREVSEAVTAAGLCDLEHGPHRRARGPRASTTCARTLDDLLTLEHPPPHVSCYALTPEPGTPLGRDPRRHPDEDATADAYDLVGEVLEEHGYRWEEISNWAKPGHECRHNHVYWDHGDYVGFGSAAHSHRTRAALLERAHTRSLHRARARAASRRSAARRSSTRRPSASSASRSRCARRAASPLEAFDSLEEIAHLVARRRRPRHARAEGAVSSRTR